MSERVEVYLKTEKGLIPGEINSWGNLTVHRVTYIPYYIAHRGTVSNVVDSRGERVGVEDILVKYEDFERFANELAANEVEIGSAEDSDYF